MCPYIAGPVGYSSKFLPSLLDLSGYWLNMDDTAIPRRLYKR